MFFFGGYYLVFWVSLQMEVVNDLILICFSFQFVGVIEVDVDKIIFVVVVDFFFDIFCVDVVLDQEDEVNNEVVEVLEMMGIEIGKL